MLSLRSIVVPDDTVAWTETERLGPRFGSGSGEGIYRMGLLSGHAPRRPTALYIGKQARQEYRRQQIAVWNKN